MTRRRKIVLGVVLGLAVLIALTAVSSARKSGRGIEVRLEPVAPRELVSVVTASGRIEPKTKVDISADITGRIVRIHVREGEWVERGTLLIQIDPAQYQSIVQRAEAFLQANEATLLQVQANRDQARRQLDRVLELRATNPNLISLEAVEQAQQAFDVALASYNSARSQVDQARASLQEARDNLAKTRLHAPIAGRVTRLAVEEGEVAVPGTFSRETGLLMTVADLTVVIAKVDVDETDVVRLSLNDSVAVSIDAFPDTTFLGRVSKISNSAKLRTVAGSTDRAVDFEVEVELESPPADIRPDLSATARIVTATRKDALAVPIIALTVREHQEVPTELAPGAAPPTPSPAGARREREGVFVVEGGLAQFRPVRVGIAGEEHFEILDGLKLGDTIVAGPYQAIRDMRDSTRVRPMADGRGATRRP
jgi:HlyD family secretion protein